MSDSVAAKQPFCIETATVADLDDLVALHMANFHPTEHFGVALGTGFMRSAYLWFLSCPQTFVLVARSGGKIFGLKAMSLKPYNIPMLCACVGAVARAVLRNPSIMTRSDISRRILAKAFRGELINDKGRVGQVGWTIVANRFQGAGIGKMLTLEAVRRCREAGLAAVYTSLRKDNAKSLAMNIRAGFVICHDELPQGYLRLKLEFNESKVEWGVRCNFVVAPLAVRDLPAVVNLHVLAFPRFFLSFLGPRFLSEFYRGLLIDTHCIGFGARAPSGQLLGIAVGPLNPQGYFRRLLFRRWWAFSFASIGAIIRDYRTVTRLVRAVSYRGAVPVAPEKALLSSIAVLPVAQGRGVGKALIQAWVLEARKRGASGCYLSTDKVNNQSVNSFYQRLGWRVESSFLKPEGRKMNLYVYDLTPLASRS